MTELADIIASILRKHSRYVPNMGGNAGALITCVAFGCSWRHIVEHNFVDGDFGYNAQSAYAEHQTSLILDAL